MTIAKLWFDREVYHTKRMQRVICVSWSLDDKYIISGSDEMNLRVWKANASQKLGVVRSVVDDLSHNSASHLTGCAHCLPLPTFSASLFS